MQDSGHYRKPSHQKNKSIDGCTFTTNKIPTFFNSKKGSIP